jgi:dsDNA-binding SOS-regulon protein
MDSIRVAEAFRVGLTLFEDIDSARTAKMQKFLKDNIRNGGCLIEQELLEELARFLCDNHDYISEIAKEDPRPQAA